MIDLLRVKIRRVQKREAREHELTGGLQQYARPRRPDR